VNALERLAELHDVDLLIEACRDPHHGPALGRMGFPRVDPEGLLDARRRIAEGCEARGLHAYDRARARYGRGMVAVRERACQGCFIRLPTSAAAAPHAVQVCESCGRVLYWR
jgi:hypothetical protein